MYRELRPDELPVDLAGAVVWLRTSAGPGSHRVVPDGCLDLIWSGRELFVAGPDTRAHLTPPADPRSYVGIRFPAGLGPAVLGVAAVDLRDARVPLAALWAPPAVRELAEALAAADDAPAVLARTVAGRHAEPDPVIRALWHRLRAGSRVDDAADAVGLSSRQLHRRSLHSFGYGPKTLARVLRFDRAVTLARTGAALSTVATRTGYADQAHLAREVREYAGVPLTALLTGADGDRDDEDRVDGDRVEGDRAGRHPSSECRVTGAAPRPVRSGWPVPPGRGPRPAR
jgi:AraC-like DNA-binding protein